MDADGYIRFLSRHPARADCTVIGVPDPLRGAGTRAFVVLGPAATAGKLLRRVLRDQRR